MPLEIPYGTRDCLPGEAARKRALENRLMALFNAHGFDEIVTPTFEYLDTLTMGSNAHPDKHLYKLFDRRNRTLALRHEMTTPIARLVASRMRNAPLPVKLAYVSSVYRYERTQTGRQCEFYQAGVELIGDQAVGTDVNVIALAITALRDVGLTDFRLYLGDVRYIHGLMAELGTGEADAADIRAALERHDLVALQSHGDLWAQVPLLLGGPGVLDAARQLAANEQSHAALNHLAAVYAALRDRHLADFVQFDLGVVRDFGYYTGVVFEGYAPRLGCPLVGGGRYDNLLAQFGYAQPAIGFALGIERLLLALA